MRQTYYICRLYADKAYHLLVEADSADAALDYVIYKIKSFDERTTKQFHPVVKEFKITPTSYSKYYSKYTLRPFKVNEAEYTTLEDACEATNKSANEIIATAFAVEE